MCTKYSLVKGEVVKAGLYHIRLVSYFVGADWSFQLAHFDNYFGDKIDDKCKISKIIQFEIPNTITITNTCSKSISGHIQSTKDFGWYYHSLLQNRRFQIKFQPLFRHFYEADVLDGKTSPKWKYCYCLRRYFSYFHPREASLPFNR